jgi:predicted N-formylglutamate amidohydrolase
MYQHATARGLAHALIEIRQDLIADDGGVAAWTARVAGILQLLNRDPTLHRVEHHGSKADED